MFGSRSQSNTAYRIDSVSDEDKKIRRFSRSVFSFAVSSIDADSAQTGQLHAGLLNWPQVTFASKFEVSADKKVRKDLLYVLKR